MDNFIVWADEKYGHESILKVESDKVVLKSGEIVSINVFHAEEKLKYKKKIGEYIYSLYSEKKQSQDDKWEASYRTKMKAFVELYDKEGGTDASILSYKELEVKVVQKAGEYFSKGDLNVIIESVPDELKKWFTKLLKIAIRSEWAERCIDEGKLAIAKGRKPNYPDFPTFN